MLQLSEGKFSLEASFWFAESDFVFWLPSHLRVWFLCCDSGPGSLTFWAQTQKWWTWKSPTMAACLQNSNTWYEGEAWVSVSWGVRKREREVGGRGSLTWHRCSLPLLQTLREQRCGNGGRANCDVSIIGDGSHLGGSSLMGREQEPSCCPELETPTCG